MVRDKVLTEATIQVEVVFSPAPRQVEQVTLMLPQGACVRDALVACGWTERVAGLSVGVWGRKSAMGHVLREHDRVEIYRGLKVDPKEARRVRYRAHGEKLPRGIHRAKARTASIT
ncbi:MAG: RnfH family protein [Pseudomonadota bacterium]